MKTVVRSQIEFVIDVKVNFITESTIKDVAATTTSFYADKLLDDSAMSDYIMFVENALAVIEYYGFQQMDDPEYGNHNISTRFMLAHELQIQNKAIPSVIVFRVSDHSQHFGKSLKQKNRARADARVQKVKMPSSKTRQRYVLDEIIVNNSTYKTYEEALNAIEQKVQSWLKKWGICTEVDEIGNW